MFSQREWAIIHPLFVQNSIQRSIAFHSSLASQSTAHKIKYGTKDVYGEKKKLSQSTEVEGFKELHLSYTIISFYIPSIINSLSASGISSAALQQGTTLPCTSATCLALEDVSCICSLLSSFVSLYLNNASSERFTVKK